MSLNVNAFIKGNIQNKHIDETVSVTVTSKM